MIGRWITIAAGASIDFEIKLSRDDLITILYNNRNVDCKSL